jgi:hypothetical protein
MLKPTRLIQRGSKCGVLIFGLGKFSELQRSKRRLRQAITCYPKKGSVTVTPTIMKYSGFTARPNAVWAATAL